MTDETLQLGTCSGEGTVSAGLVPPPAVVDRRSTDTCPECGGPFELRPEPCPDPPGEAGTACAVKHLKSHCPRCEADGRLAEAYVASRRDAPRGEIQLHPATPDTALQQEIEFAIGASFLWDKNADSGAAKRLRDSILAVIRGEQPTTWTDPATGTVWPLTGRLIEQRGGEWWTHSGWMYPLDGDPIPTFACHHLSTGDVRDKYMYAQLPEVIRRYGPLEHDAKMPVDHMAEALGSAVKEEDR